MLTETGALSPLEVDRCRSYVEQTGKAVVEATEGLSEAQWRYKTAPDRWSIAEALEHVVFIQELVLGPVRERLAAAPAVSGERDYQQVEDVIYRQFPERTIKIDAPGLSHPAGRWTPQVALDRLKANCERLREYVESTPDLRLRVIESAPLKAITQGALEYMDGYQWVLACAAHTKRHTEQIREVLADPWLPAKKTPAEAGAAS